MRWVAQDNPEPPGLDCSKSMQPVKVKEDTQSRSFLDSPAPAYFRSMTTAPRRLIGTPAFVNEAGTFLPATQASVRRAVSPSAESANRLLGTPCYVTVSGDIVSSPSRHRSGLKRLLGTPCFVTETGEIVGAAHFKEETKCRLPGTPCFVDQDHQLIHPRAAQRTAVKPSLTSEPLRLLGTPCFVSRDGVIEPPSSSRRLSTVAFAALPGDAFRFDVTSDKLETVVTLESPTTASKWQCRFDDSGLADCAPTGVVLPRSALANFLSEALGARAQARASRNQVEMVGSELKLTLGLADNFSPVYMFPLTRLVAPKQEQKHAEVAALKAQVAALKLQIRKLTAMSATHDAVA